MEQLKLFNIAPDVRILEAIIFQKKEAFFEELEQLESHINDEIFEIKAIDFRNLYTDVVDELKALKSEIKVFVRDLELLPITEDLIHRIEGLNTQKFENELKKILTRYQ